MCRTPHRPFFIVTARRGWAILCTLQTRLSGVKTCTWSNLCLSRRWQVTHMWQSRVEIEGYSVVYFDCITVFEAPYHWTSVKGGAHMHFVDIHGSMKRVWALPLTEVQRYGTSNTEMRSKYTTGFLHRTATHVLCVVKVNTGWSVLFAQVRPPHWWTSQW